MSMLFQLLIFTLFSLSSNLYAYDNSNFKGNYSFRFDGTSSYVVARPSETVAAGLIKADGKGRISGHGRFRTSGITCVGTIVGKYNLAPDGTGVLTSAFTPNTPGCFQGVLDLFIVLFDKGNGFDAATFENDYLSGTLHRQTFK